MKMCVIIEEFLYAKKIENQTQRTLRGYKNGAAKEWMQCRDSQRKKKAASESAHKVQRNMEKRL